MPLGQHAAAFFFQHNLPKEEQGSHDNFCIRQLLLVHEKGSQELAQFVAVLCKINI